MSRATRHVLLSEYGATLAKVAAEYGADPGAGLFGHSATWSAPLGGLSITIRLDHDRDGEGRAHMRPVLSIDSSAGIPMDPFAALTMMADATATIHRAHTAYLSIHAGSIAVWDRDCPCTECSGRGTQRGTLCRRCDGAGVRQEPAGGAS